MEELVYAIGLYWKDELECIERDDIRRLFYYRLRADPRISFRYSAVPVNGPGTAGFHALGQVGIVMANPTALRIYGHLSALANSRRIEDLETVLRQLRADVIHLQLTKDDHGEALARKSRVSSGAASDHQDLETDIRQLRFDVAHLQATKDDRDEALARKRRGPSGAASDQQERSEAHMDASLGLMRVRLERLELAADTSVKEMESRLAYEMLQFKEVVGKRLRDMEAQIRSLESERMAVAVENTTTPNDEDDSAEDYDEQAALAAALAESAAASIGDT